MARYATHRSPRSLLGPRAGAPAPALRANPPRPSTPRSLREYRQRTKRLMEERIKRRDHALAKKLGLLPPTPPPKPKLSKPPPIAVTRQQRAKQAQRAKLEAVWEAMEEAGQDKIGLSPKTAPAWDAPPPSKGQIRSPDRLPELRGSPSIDSRRFEQAEALAETRAAIRRAQERAAEKARQTDRALLGFRSRLSRRQLAAGVADDFDPYCIAEHTRLFGWRHGRFER